MAALVFYITDDHDYFDNDDATPGRYALDASRGAISLFDLEIH